MMNRLPEVIEPGDFPRTKSCYQTTIPLDRFPRLMSYVRPSVGDVVLELALGIDASGHSMISGRVTVDLCLQCQRCLDDCTQRLDKQFNFCVLEQEPGKAMEDNIEPLILGENETINTLELIEDELIFELPVYAVHPNIEDCDQTMIARATEYTEEKRPNPFAILKNLKESE